MRFTLCAFLLVIMFVGGCSSTPTAGKEESISAEELYLKSYKLLQEQEYTEAAETFDKIDRQYPYSPWAAKAQIMSAYSYYLKGSYDDAILTLDRFIQLHPGNQYTVYAFYLKGLSYYNQISDIGREQQMSKMALETFNTLLARYPYSMYTNDAMLKMEQIQDQLAGKDMEVGRYYLQNKEYYAALNRFQDVIANYPVSTQVPEAYYRLAVVMKALGLKEQMNSLLAVAERKFPESEWFKKMQKLVK